ITKDEMQGVPHHLVDFLTPDQAVSVFDFQKRAFEIIDDIIARGKTPLLVGGTGFYISAVIENYQLRPGVVDQKLRDELNALTLEALQERVKEFNPPLTLDIKNKVRIVRFIENKLADASYEPTLEVPKYDVLIIEPEFDREMLNKRINARVKLMFENGLVGEVAGLVDKYGKDAPAFNAIGYREFLPYNNLSDLKNDDLSAIREEIAINSRHYAKRQITWFRRYLNKYIHKDLSTTLLKVHDFLT
ncbi:tRNA (adenosine(37)-N6)-dimethylallyltransferase MiaA, partial [Candidatus Falkowbacteria bacterium]|nr:tRNA (adenosine(37)-N6)-dimethylallyltransferase MiaA [Candidatus Falkowbacteria bacterium]